MTRTPVTNDEILDRAEVRTGLQRNQLLVLVAKSATVRHLARHPKYKDLFVLKGGTLLSNVYQSPRQSIADADCTYLDPENLTVPELEQALATHGTYASESRTPTRREVRRGEGRSALRRDQASTRSRPRLWKRGEAP